MLAQGRCGVVVEVRFSENARWRLDSFAWYQIRVSVGSTSRRFTNDRLGRSPMLVDLEPGCVEVRVDTEATAEREGLEQSFAVEAGSVALVAVYPRSRNVLFVRRSARIEVAVMQG